MPVCVRGMKLLNHIVLEMAITARLRTNFQSQVEVC